jgi:hypothetical protein
MTGSRARIRRPGLNIVNSDGARSEINCSSTHEARECSFGHAIDTRTGEGGADSRVAANEDDLAPVLHVSSGCLNSDEGGTDVDGHHSVKIFETVGIDWAHGENARVANEDVEPAQGLQLSWPQRRSSSPMPLESPVTRATLPLSDLVPLLPLTLLVFDHHRFWISLSRMEIQAGE